jgi:ribonuclease P protein component
VLPNHNRLRQREEFAQVYANGDRYRGTHLMLRTLKIKGNSEDISTKIGIVVSKKVSKLAVSRNRFKRQLRAILRQLLSQLDNKLRIVITVTTQGQPSYQQLQEDLKNLLTRAKVL